MSKSKIVVLQGGWSSEREVSFMSASQIIKNLDTEKYAVFLVEVPSSPDDRKWVLELIKNKPDVVFSALHGGAGEDGTIQGLLDSLNFRYVGSKVLASAIAMDKQLTRILLERAGLPVANGQLVKSVDEVRLGLPLVVKPNDGGSSIGVTIVKDADKLRGAMEQAFIECENVLLEEFVEGEEITCGVVETQEGLVALDILKIKPATIFYDFDAKYHDEDTDISVFKANKTVLTRLQNVAMDVFALLGCAGCARVDMIYTPKRTVVLEVNTLPGMTSHSLIPKAAASRWSYSDFLDLLINVELSRQ